jgi:(2R)-3-sulfolactate dehydrogenase (NADP+)
MTSGTMLGLDAAEALATAAFVANRSSEANARVTARALVAAEADGQAGHGLSRVAPYALHARVGKVDGHAVPACTQVAAAALRVDAAHGFAYPALEIALGALPALAATQGIAAAAIHRSHHFGVAGHHAERLASAGLVALVLGNTPKAMALHGGRQPMLGTNPLAFAAPLPDGAPPLVIDLALSVAARGKIVAAQKAARAIPADWAVDEHGAPTTDPDAALRGALSPIGGAKGAALALMVEVLAAAVTGSSFGWEASSMFDDRDGPPNVGHVLIAIDPVSLSGGGFEARMRTLVAAFAAEPGVRLPGSRRLAARARAAREGLALAPALLAEIRQLAGAATDA